MKILHINSNYLFTKLHEELINHLNNLNNKNIIFMPLKKGVNIRNFSTNKLIVEESFNEVDRYFFYRKQRNIYYKLINGTNIKMNNFNIIHAHTLFTDGNLAYRLYNDYKIPYIITIRNTDINVFFKKRIFLRKRGINILRNASAVVFLSASSRKFMFDKYIPQNEQLKIKNKSYIIPNGISDYWFKNINRSKKTINPKNIRLLYVGRIDRNKNIMATLDSIKHLQTWDIEVEYTIIGKVKDEKIMKKIKNKATKLNNLKLNIKSYVDKEELIKYYRNNDIFVMPSIYESFGLVYAEAMSQGLPVIYTRDQGFDGQFIDGHVGYSVNSYSSEDIANKIKLIIDNYETISKNTIRSLEKFNWQHSSKQYNKVYNNIFTE